MIYALADQTDYMVFDADLFEAYRSPVVGHPQEYVPLCMVELEPGKVELLRGEGIRFVIHCDGGVFAPQAIVCGEADAWLSVLRTKD